MSNPLSLFRRHQRTLIAVFGVFIVLVFVVGGSIDKMFSGPRRGVNGVVVSWENRTINQQQLRLLHRRHGMAMDFLQRVANATRKKEGSPKVALIQPAADERELVVRILLADEAERLGVVVGDQAVLDYLDQLSDKGLTDQEFRKFLREAGGDATEDLLFEQLKQELLALRMQEMAAAGLGATTPSQSWEYYVRLNQQAVTEVYAVKAEDYLDQVTEPPKDVDLKAIFEAGKDRYPNPNLPEPGFHIGTKIAFQYFKADFEELLKEELKSITDEQILKEYEKQVADGQHKTTAPLPSETDEKGEDSEKTDSEKKSGKEDEPAEKKEDGKEPAKPGTAKKSDEPGSAAKPKEKDVPADSDEGCQDPPATDKPATDKPATDKPATDKAATDKPATDKPATDKAAGDKAAGDEAAGDEAATDKPATDKPANQESGSESAPSTGDAKTVEPPKAPVERIKSLEEVKDSIARSLARPGAQDKLDAGVKRIEAAVRKYGAALSRFQAKVVDKLVENQDLLPKLVQEQIKERGTRAIDDYLETELDNLDLTKLGLENEKPADLDLETLADELGFTLGVTFLNDAVEIAETEIGQATTFSFANGNFQQIPFSQSAYTSGVPLYATGRIGGQIRDTTFIYWRTKMEPARVPDFDEVRDDVVKVWKLQQAFAIAQKAAEGLKVKANEAKDKPLAESLGEAEGKAVARPLPFSWLTVGSAQGMFGQSQQGMPRIGTVQVSRKDDEGEDVTETVLADRGFMESVFSIEPGHTDLAINQPKTEVYVVRVEDHYPSNDLLRRRFMTTGPTNSELFLSRMDQQQILRQWYLELQDDRGFQWDPGYLENLRSQQESR